jgi:tRNA(fMet)-specific endonuclease VapC
MKESILDTDIISFYLKGDQNVVENVFKYLEEFPTLSLSTISYFEVLAGLEYKKATKKIKAFKEFTSNCTILNVDKSSLSLVLLTP